MKINKTSYLISLLYVVLGTVSVLSVYPKDLLFGEWSLYGVLFTFPVSIISFGYRYAESDSVTPVYFIQFSMLLFIWVIFYLNRGKQKGKVMRVKAEK